MVSHERGRSFFISSASILLLFHLATSLYAQSRPLVRCDALVGFNGVAREGRFAPLLVSIENPGPRLPVEVRVEVTWGSDLRGTLVRRSFTRNLLLAGGAARRIPFLIPLMRDARSLTVNVSSQGTELAREQVDLRSVATADRLIAGITSELSLDALAGLSDAGGPVRIVYPRVDDLPESWAGYDGVEMVVVHDTWFRQLRAAQVTALERWVVTGGTLVFTGGAAAIQHTAAGLDRLLPVTVVGLRERGDLPSLASFTGLRAGPRGRMIVAEARVTAGTVVAAQDGMPVIVERRLGRGAIWFTAFDPTLPPFDSWDGTLPLWRLMAENVRQPTLNAVTRDPVDDPWMKAIIDTPPLSFPSVLIIAAFAGGYLALFMPLVVGRVSRRLGRRLRIALLLAVPAAASVAGWLVFNKELFRPEPRLLDVATVQVVSGDGMAFVTERLGLFASRAGTCDLSLDALDVAIDEVSPMNPAVRTVSAGRSELTVAGDNGTVIRGIAYDRFGSRLFALSQVIQFPFEASVKVAESSLSVEVSNASARPVRGCFLVRAGKGYSIGDIASGATVTRVFTPDEGVDLREPIALERIAGDGRRGELWRQEGAKAGGASGIVAGWLDGPALPVVAAGAWRPADRPALSLVLLEVR